MKKTINRIALAAIMTLMASVVIPSQAHAGILHDIKHVIKVAIATITMQ